MNYTFINETADIDLMSKTLGISKTMSQIMVNRGIRTKNTSIRYLRPKLELLHDVKLMRGVDALISLIQSAISHKDKIVIFGDYDVDGITSIAILFKTLVALGADCHYYIPNREYEGYGINKAAIDALHKEGARLIVCCDNGITALDEIEHAKSLGMQIAIIDHHEPPMENGTQVLPCADATVNPKQAQCSYPFKSLCAAGLVYKIAGKLFDTYNKPNIYHDEFLVFAMIATFCDVVELKEENRIIAYNGLKRLNANKSINPGLYALLALKNLSVASIVESDIGFKIGPCINASGRLGDAKTAVELLITQDPVRIGCLAQKLTALNETRKTMTNTAFEEIIDSIDPNNTDKIIIKYCENLHESLAGIIAGKLKEKFHKPSIILTTSNDVLKGSGRSIPAYDMFKELTKVKDLFIKFGGHPMAAGISLPKENLQQLIDRLTANATITDSDCVKRHLVDLDLNFSEIEFSLANELKLMAPFGTGNKQPLFITTGVSISELKFIDKKNTMLLKFKAGNKQIRAVCFGKNNQFRDLFLRDFTNANETGLIFNEKYDIIYYVELNCYNNKTTLQLRLIDFALTNNYTKEMTNEQHLSKQLA